VGFEQLPGFDVDATVKIAEKVDFPSLSSLTPQPCFDSLFEYRARCAADDVPNIGQRRVDHHLLRRCHLAIT